MAAVQERLATSLEALKEYQDRTGSMVLNGKDCLGVTHTDRLLENGYLKQVLKGWYIADMPGNEGDTTVWYTSYWQFIAAYCNIRFPDGWCLTPEESLAFHSGQHEAPIQLIVRSPKASNNIVSLLYGTSLFDIKAAIPENVIIDQETGIRLYPMAEALVATTPSFYTSNPINARTCLASVSADDILKIVSDGGYSVRAGRMAGALRNIGRTTEAERIMSMMKRLGYDVRESDPFDEVLAVPYMESPYAVRISLLWQKMRLQILELGLGLSYNTGRNIEDVLARMDSKYVADAYHSLSIEGYRVTEGLIERVRSGVWDPKSNEEDVERKNALAARGYYQAFQKIRESIKDIFAGSNPGEIFTRDHESWHFELFEPCVQCGIVRASDLVGYRTSQVYIRSSRHTPMKADAVRHTMAVLCDLLKKEDDGFVRAVLGHFFFVYIHPYMDGNGRTARFVMNVMLCSCGLDWTVVPTERRKEYFESLETASVDEDIRPFARFIASLMNQGSADLCKR